MTEPISTKGAGEKDGWALFSDSSSSDDGNDNAFGERQIFVEDDLSKQTTQSRKCDGNTEPWEKLIPHGLGSDGRLSQFKRVHWRHTALQASTSSRAPFHAKLNFQSCAVEFKDNAKDMGGGRAFYATEDIAPGTLLLREVVSVPLPSAKKCAELGFNSRTAGLLHDAVMANHAQSRNLVLEDMQKLFPRNLSDLSDEYLQNTLLQFGSDLTHLAHLIKHRARGDDPLIDAIVSSNHVEEIYQDEEKNCSGNDIESGKLVDGLLCLLCSIHCNAFVNGMHMHLAMLNHSCRPNCVKLGKKGGPSGYGASEIWSTEPIARGEEITISYLLPRMQSCMTRQKKLKKQFEFDCGCRLCRQNTGLGDNGLERQAEKALEVDSALAASSGTFANNKDLNDGAADLISRFRWSLELHKKITLSSMTPNNLVFARLCGLIARLCQRILEEEYSDQYRQILDMPTAGNIASTASLLKEFWLPISDNWAKLEHLEPKLLVASVYLSVSLMHFETQMILQGPFPHAEMATSLGDISGAARIILAYNGIAISSIIKHFPTISKFAPSQSALARMESFCGRAAKTIGDKIFVPSFEMAEMVSGKSGISRPANPKTCHVICGAPAAGKSHLAKILAQELSQCVCLIDSDVISSRLISAGLKLAGLNPNDRDSVTYKEAFREQVYETMFDIACCNLEAVQSGQAAQVVMCGPFTKECKDPKFPVWLQQRLGGNGIQIEMHFVYCGSDSTRKERMLQRGAPRDQSKLMSEDAWSKHTATCLQNRPVWPHHFFDNTVQVKQADLN